MKYQIISPNGYRGMVIEAGTADEAVAIAESAPYHEKILDLIMTEDEDNQPVIGLVVEDDPLYS